MKYTENVRLQQGKLKFMNATLCRWTVLKIACRPVKTAEEQKPKNSSRIQKVCFCSFKTTS